MKKSLSTCCDVDEYGPVMCTSGLLLQFACGDLDVYLLVGMRRFGPCWRLSHAWMTSSWTFEFHLLHKILFTPRCGAVVVGEELLFTHDTKMHRIPEIRARWESLTPVSELRYDLGDVNAHSECLKLQKTALTYETCCRRPSTSLKSLTVCFVGGFWFISRIEHWSLTD